MQSQPNEIGDLPQRVAFWRNQPEESALVYAFYLLLADLELEDVFAEFTAREERNQVDGERARDQPTGPV